MTTSAWGQGRDYDGVLEGDPWTPQESDLSDVARSALNTRMAQRL